MQHNLEGTSRSNKHLLERAVSMAASRCAAWNVIEVVDARDLERNVDLGDRLRAGSLQQAMARKRERAAVVDSRALTQGTQHVFV